MGCRATANLDPHGSSCKDSCPAVGVELVYLMSSNGAAGEVVGTITSKLNNVFVVKGGLVLV